MQPSTDPWTVQTSRPHPIEPRPAGPHAVGLHLIATFALAALLVSCGGAPAGGGGPDKKPNPLNGGLFLNGGGAAHGLFLLDHDNGTAYRLGDGLTEYDYAGGLAWGGPSRGLLGSDFYDLYAMPLNGTAPVKLNSGMCSAEGLAMDLENDLLYKIVNGILHTASPDTCEHIEELIYPGIDMEGLELDAENQLLYGIGRGSTDLYFIDVAAGAPYSWTAVGTTGTTWANAGLALDPEAGVLYAVGNEADPAGLYRIDPTSGATQRVGNTGLAAASGGLAWVPSQASP